MLKSEVKEFKYKRIMVKLTAREEKVLQKKARLYTNGNASAWIRYAATKLEPNPTDLVGLEIEEK